MTCDDVLALLPDDGAETAGHLRACASCRAAQERYEQDGLDLAKALRGAAATPHRRPSPRRWMPVAAAAALLLCLLALAFSPVPPPERPAPADRLEFLVSRENALWGQVLAVDPLSGEVAVSVGLRDGVVPRQELTLYRRAPGGEIEVGTLVVDRVESAVSAGRFTGSIPPAPGDFALADRLLDAHEKAAVLDHLFSFRPVHADDERRLLDALRRLESQDLAARASGRRDLLAGGGPYRVLLDRGRLPLDLQVRAREALAETDRIDRIVRDAGLEHDVDFLSRLRDPRAYGRLRAILSLVLPAFPPPGPEFADRLHNAWMAVRPRARWNPETDRYE